MLLSHPSVPSIMESLKTTTQPHHEAAEASGFNQELVQGTLPRDVYVESLSQMLVVHRRLEDRVRALRGTVPAIGRILSDEQFQQPRLRADIEHFMGDPDASQPLPCTSDFLTEIDRFAEGRSVALLGVAYVFEGSNNGAKMLMKAVQRAYQLTDGQGTRSLDPYGARQRENWATFKQNMNAEAFEQEELRSIVAAACRTFEWVARLHADLRPDRSADAASAAKRVIADASGPRCPVHHSRRGDS